MGRLKEAWLAAVEDGREEQFLDSFPELDAEDRARIKNLLGVQLLCQEAMKEGAKDGDAEGVPN